MTATTHAENPYIWVVLRIGDRELHKTSCRFRKFSEIHSLGEVNRPPLAMERKRTAASSIHNTTVPTKILWITPSPSNLRATGPTASTRFITPTETVVMSRSPTKAANPNANDSG